MTLATLKADDLRAQAEQTHDRRQRSQFFDEIRRRGGARLSELSGQDGSLLTACNWRKLAEKDPVDAAVSLAVLMDRKRLRKGLEDEIAKTWMQNLADEALLVIVCIMARAEVAPVLKMVATENPDLFATAAERLTKTKSQGDRKAAAGMLAYVVPDSSIVPRMIKVGSRLLRAKLDAARAMAMEALANLGWKQVLRTARNVLEQGRTAMAGAALHVIGLFGTERDAPRLLQYVRRYLRHRPQLAETMDKIAKHLTIDLLREGLLQGSPDDQVAALSEISKRLPRPKLDRLLLNILPGLKNDMFADRVYKHLRQNEELAPQAIEAALKGKSSHLMKSVVDDIARGLSSSFTPRLKMLVAWGGGIVPEFDGQALSDGNGFPPIQKDASRRSLAASAALTRLADAMRPEQAADFVRLQFDSPAPAVRHAALTWFAKERQRLLPIEALLPLVRDPSDPVAGTALTMLLNYDDPRRLGEMASLIVQQKIGRHALAGARHLRGAAQSFQKLMSEQDIKDLVQQIEETIEWAKDAGRLLLGRDVEVKLLRWAMGRTRRARRGQTPTIEITDKPIAQRHPHGQEIMRALALHELGHHAFDFDHAGQTTIAGLIRKDGLFPIYNAMLDERLERRLRRKNSERGALMDRLLS